MNEQKINVNKTVASTTLGCKVNKYDTEAMIKIFDDNGYSEVEFDEFADVYVINTCTVTNLSDKKSRQMIRKVKKINPNAIIVATGCYAQVSPEEVAKIEGVNIVIGTKDRSKIVELVENYNVDNGVKNIVTDIMKERDFEKLDINKIKGMTRAYLKIQEGCNQFCTYCIIPYARGGIRSRIESEVLEEVQNLANNGFKEVVLAGIHIASYGKDLKNTNLLQLLKKVNEVEGIERIRFSSVEPNLMTEEFVKELSTLDKICHHFHLSLQSGCDETLKRMNRKYTTEEFSNCVRILRKYYTDVAITTDVIVGFPQETDIEFEETYKFCEKIEFSKMHIFPFSPKKGTKAYDMSGQVDNDIKNNRAKQLRELSDKMAYEFNKKYINTSQNVLIEKKIGDNIYEGHTSNYMTVQVSSEKDIVNHICNITVKKCDNDIIVGSL